MRLGTSTAGLIELQEAARSPLARPSAAQLLPGAQSAEGIPRLEGLLLKAAQGAPHGLAAAASDLGSRLASRPWAPPLATAGQP